MREELLKGLSEEQIAKLNECNSAEEILELAKAEGVQLSDEQLEAVSGGGCSTTLKCKKCGSKDVIKTSEEKRGSAPHDGGTTVCKFKCKTCGNEWKSQSQ